MNYYKKESRKKDVYFIDYLMLKYENKEVNIENINIIEERKYFEKDNK